MVLFDSPPVVCAGAGADGAWLDAELIAAAARRSARDESPAAEDGTAS